MSKTEAFTELESVQVIGVIPCLPLYRFSRIKEKEYCSDRKYDKRQKYIFNPLNYSYQNDRPI